MPLTQVVVVTVLVASPFVAWCFPVLRGTIMTPLSVLAYAVAYSAAALAASLASSGTGTGPLDVVLLVAGLLGAVAVTMVLGRGLPGELRPSDWIAPLAMIGLGLLTAFLSGPQGGAGRLMHFLLDVLRLSPEAAQAVNFLVRKGAHLTVYGLIAMTAGSVARRQGQDVRGVWAAGLGWALVHAVLDESHQSTTTLRTGAASDVLLDTCGAALALTVLTRKRVKLRSEGSP